MAEEAVIRLKDVSKTFRLGKRSSVELTVLDNVSLSVEAGEFVALVGPSGAGKSTLLYLMGILDRPSSGKVYFKGRDIAAMKDRELARLRLNELGFVFQNYNLIPTLTTLENIATAQIMDSGMGRGNRRALELLELVGLKDRANHRPNQLSGGEQQRIAIARAMFGNPSVILADEPTGNLDSRTGLDVIKLFKDLNKKSGTTIVLVTHNQALAENAGRQIQVVDGKIVQQ